ncbi:carbohydrate esterase family 16 protein [Pseudocercospora fijiensis CIRAD86]|uniref:Carbohydrate esterase family 16 protein n=1 Tax=Pseudocercospora fijiensis (strain CIRAD86) TaxID=383855 RepID=M3AVB5_PSEFD|nr:carbohydrate esterase family 16 protein [Pseudocercospora fijiensis CIRAD86]EME81427.1 carbohydrate esterase family 16 protein [Pseudocercospora fijiensis CIRAD86]
MWPGWCKISHMIVFGDSYTATGFNVSGAQPCVDNPLGNPPFPGHTSSNGPNWVDYLTLDYNATYLQTVNLAYGGATVDSALVTPYLPTVLSVKQQIQDEYQKTYANHPATFAWKAKNTLFAIWIGINDVGNAYAWSNSSQVYPKIWSTYSSLVEELYTSGARNFLFINVPPVNRSPLTMAQPYQSQTQERKDIEAWNANLTTMVNDLHKKHKDTTVFPFDAYKLFGQVLDDPCSFDKTYPYKNTTSYCEAYANGTPDWYTYNATCGISVDQYFWLNSLHPTFRMHDLLAQQIGDVLNNSGKWSS